MLIRKGDMVRVVTGDDRGTIVDVVEVSLPSPIQLLIYQRRFVSRTYTRPEYF